MGGIRNQGRKVDAGLYTFGHAGAAAIECQVYHAYL
jgi:hypothetical protein